jgi:hypothetical protein
MQRRISLAVLLQLNQEKTFFHSKIIFNDQGCQKQTIHKNIEYTVPNKRYK